MLPNERLKRICDLVNEKGSVRVSELSQLLSVSEVTVRRDLEALARDNRLQRTHGGAFSTLANTAVGVACCTVGAKTVTLNITTDFIKNIRAGETAWAEAHVLHRGRKTIVLDAKLYDDHHSLLCQTMATMYVKGDDERIPKEW